MYFEQLIVGDTSASASRQITGADLEAMENFQNQTGLLCGAPAPHSCLPSAVTPALLVLIAIELLNRLDLVGQAGNGTLSESWTWHESVHLDDVVTVTATVIRLEPLPTGPGRVTLARIMTRGDSTVVMEGSAQVLVPTKGGERSTARDVGTKPWGLALANILGDDEAFRSSVASWDGTIGVRGGSHEVHFRIYCGRVIEVTSRSPLGATFTLSATDSVWTDILMAPSLRFGTRMMSGQFAVTGNPYEYLRLTKALELMVEAARALAHADGAEETA